MSELIVKIVSARYKNRSTTNWIEVTLENADKKSVSVEDGVRREYSKSFDKYLEDGGKIEPYETPKQKKAREVKELKTDLSFVYSMKKQECLDFISETSYTKEIDDEYKTKMKLATEAIATSDFTAFEIDAKALSALKGETVTAEQYAQLITTKGSKMIPSKDVAVLRMGTVRTIIAGLIEAGAVEKAKEVLEKVKLVNAETIVTADEAQILGLLS